MREILFKIWDKREKRFLTHPEVNNIGGFYYQNGVTPNPESYEMFQYTGLIDKHLVKIFEGDIIEQKVTANARPHRVVEYEITIKKVDKDTKKHV